MMLHAALTNAAPCCTPPLRTPPPPRMRLPSLLVIVVVGAAVLEREGHDDGDERLRAARAWARYTTVGVVAWVCFGKDLFSGASAAPAAGRDSDDEEDCRHRDSDDDEDAVRALLGAPMRRRRRDANEALPVEWSRY